MNLENLNKKIILIFIVLILGSYLFISNYYKSYSIEQEVISKIEKIDSIKNYEIKNREDLKLFVQFENDINILNSYKKLLNIKESYNEDLEIIIKNEKEKDIESIYYDIHHYLYEAIERKNYSEIKNKIDYYMKNNNLKYALYFDNEKIYFQFNYKNKSYYKILKGV